LEEHFNAADKESSEKRGGISLASISTKTFAARWQLDLVNPRKYTTQTQQGTYIAVLSLFDFEPAANLTWSTTDALPYIVHLKDPTPHDGF
jgi:hypothetical protein